MRPVRRASFTPSSPKPRPDLAPSAGREGFGFAPALPIPRAARSATRLRRGAFALSRSNARGGHYEDDYR
jgi:hypothetical protein